MGKQRHESGVVGTFFHRLQAGIGGFLPCLAVTGLQVDGKAVEHSLVGRHMCLAQGIPWCGGGGGKQALGCGRGVDGAVEIEQLAVVIGGGGQKDHGGIRTADLQRVFRACRHLAALAADE